MMRTIGRRVVLALLASTLGLTACTSNAPEVAPTTTPTPETDTGAPSESTPTDAATPTVSEDPEAAASAEIDEAFVAYTQAKAEALQEGPTPPVLVEHLEGLATGSWIIELQNGYGAAPVPVDDPPTHQSLTIMALNLDAGTAAGTSCYGPVRVSGEQRMVVADITLVRGEGVWLVDGDRPDGASSCDG